MKKKKIDLNGYGATADLKFVKGKLYQLWVSYFDKTPDVWVKVKGQ